MVKETGSAAGGAGDGEQIQIPGTELAANTVAAGDANAQGAPSSDANKNSPRRGKANDGKKDAPPRAFVPLQERRCQEGDFVVKDLAIEIDLDQPLEHLVRRDYWANVAQKLQPGARITVRYVDQSGLMELMCRACGRGWADVFVTRDMVRAPSGVDLPPEAAAEFEIGYQGNIEKWGIIRKSDRRRVASDLPTESDAKRWVLDHLRRAAA